MDDDKAMIRLLDADGPDPERADGLMLFGRFIGSWDIEAVYWDHDGNETARRVGEWHFGWVLQGRAIQDVLISPPLASGEPSTTYGSSFRQYDPATDTWRVSWFSPIPGVLVDLTARRDGETIVLEGVEPSGMLDRWVFSDITDDSFTWTGYESLDEGRTWPLIERMLAHRRAG